MIRGEGLGVGSSLPETAAGMGILAGFEGIFGVFKTSSKSGFGLHSFGVSACVWDSHASSVSGVPKVNVESSAEVVNVAVERGTL
jgi:hypothetical protein